MKAPSIQKQMKTWCLTLFLLTIFVTRSLGEGFPKPGEKIEIEEDPLDLERTFGSDYRNWAGIISQVVLAKENNNEVRARRSLHKIMLDTHHHLMNLAEGKFEPVWSVSDPIFVDDISPSNNKDFHKKKKNIPTTFVTGISLSKTFFTYAPAVVSVSHTGIGLSATGVLFAPSLIALGPGIATFAAQGIAISPVMAIIAPAGINIQPQGAAVSPTLCLIVPAGVNIQPQGVNIGSSLGVIAPTGVNIQPQGVAIGPVDTLHAPTGVSVGK